MLQNFTKIAWRNLFKNKVFSLVNILGLALGMACCFLILLFVRHEYSYDQFHPNKDRLYRVNYLANFSGSELELTRIPSPIGPVLTDYFPGVEAAARLYMRSVSARLIDSDKQFEVERAIFADSTATDVFAFDFLHGNAETALDRPFSLVLTDETAERFYGTTNVLGKTLRLADLATFTVTGVIKAFPDNAHLHFDFLAPFQNMVDVEPDYSRENIQDILANNWLASHSYTYLTLKPNQSAEAVNAKFADFIKQYGDPTFSGKQNFKLFPVKDIHIYSTAEGEPEAPANLSYIYIFIAIGFMTLLIACINFINLSTASSFSRAQEVGVRKVLGAERSGLVGQFLGESLMLCFIAFVLSLILVQIGVPFLSELTDREVQFSLFQDFRILLVFAGIFLLAGVLAGSYPAFFVSRFKPTTILKGSPERPSGTGVSLRKVLIGVQFLVALLLIGATMTIFNQLEFLRTRPLGFQQEQMLTIPLFSANFNAVFAPGDAGLRQKMNTFEEELLTNPNIEAVTLSSTRPGFGGVNYPITTDSITAEDNVFLTTASVDYDFVETYQLEMVAGRDFDKEFGTDHLDAYVINEQAVRELGWKTPEAALGKRLTRGGKEGKVIGVMKDFNFMNLRYEIQPLILDVVPGTFTFFSMRLRNENLPQTIEYISSVWEQFFPQKVFEYYFLDESLQDMYDEESRLSSIIGYFAFLAIFISCFGLFGLVTYAIHQKTKEIGIRKVLGASVSSILLLLSKDFIRLIVIAGVLALPVTYYSMDWWLTNYAYHIELSWLKLLLPIPIVLLIALLTLSALTIRAALSNPVESLRSE